MNIVVFEISHSTGNASLLDTRGVFACALQIGTNNIMLIHKYPSGMPLLFREDFDICRRMVRDGELLGVPVLDLVVIGNDDFGSYLKRDIIKDFESPYHKR